MAGKKPGRYRKTYILKPAEAKREKLKNDIALLYLQGIEPREFHTRLGITKKYARTLFEALREDWKRSNTKAFDERVTEEYIKIAAIEAEAWRQYMASDGIEVTTVKEGENVVRVIERKSPTRQSQWYAQIQWCSSQRLKLLGLQQKGHPEPLPPIPDAPTHSELIAAAEGDVKLPSDDEISNFTDEELQEQKRMTQEALDLESRWADLQAKLNPSNN